MILLKKFLQKQKNVKTIYKGDNIMKKFIERKFHIGSEGRSDSFNGTCIVINYKNKTLRGK